MLVLTICQLLQLLLLVYPPRYWPCACIMRREMKKARSKLRQQTEIELNDALCGNGSRPPTAADGFESTKELVRYSPNDESQP